MSERRKCPVCKTKWKVRFLGRIELSSYFCEKCGIVHSHIIAPLEFFEIPEKYRNHMTLVDCDRLLGSLTHKKSMTLKELMERSRGLEEKSDEARQFEFDYDRATASMLDIFKVLVNRYNKVCYTSPFIRLLRILGNGKWISTAKIKREYGSKYVDHYLNVTRLWYLTYKSKQGREVLYKITSKGKAFLSFVDKARRVLPEGTSIFDDKVSRLKRLE